MPEVSLYEGNFYNEELETRPYGRVFLYMQGLIPCSTAGSGKGNTGPSQGWRMVKGHIQESVCPVMYWESSNLISRGEFPGLVKPNTGNEP